MAYRILPSVRTMQNPIDPKATQTAFLHIDLSNLRELIGDAPDAELHLARLGLGTLQRQTANLREAVETANFTAVLSSVRGLGTTLTALHAERAHSTLKAVELFASLQDADSLKFGVAQFEIESELVCKNLEEQVVRLGGKVS